MMVIFHRPILSRNIISPNCLRVDRAISFFRSVSQHAAILVVNIVIRHRDEIVVLFRWNVKLYRIIRNTPAVTSVEE
jgi:hypothetical protein